MKLHLKRWMKSTLAVSLLMGPSLIEANMVVDEQKLIHPSKNNPDQGIDTSQNVGGDSVSIEGEWAFVGDVDRCQVHVYKWDYVTNKWGDGGQGIGGVVTPDIPYIELRSTGSCATSDYAGFGATVSSDNGVVVIGAPQAKNGGSTNGGKIFLYHYDPAEAATDTADIRLGWVRHAAIEEPKDWNGTAEVSDGQDDAGFGTSVSVRATSDQSKAIIVVGAPFYDYNQTELDERVDSGKVYIYEWDDATETSTLVNSDIGHNAGDQLGTAVISNGDELLASAPYWDGNATITVNPNSGIVYMFDYNITTHALEHEREYYSGDGITPALPDDFNLGITLSYSDNILALGGTDSLVYDHNHTAGTTALVSTVEGTNKGDVSQSGTYISLATRGNGAPGTFDVHFDKNTLATLNPTPDFHYEKNETDYGRDVSLNLPNLMVNGNQNNTDGTGEGIAYAYYPVCGFQGSLVAYEYQVIGLQCDVNSSGTTKATIDEIFSPDLGVYDTNWTMYSRKSPNYDGRSSSYYHMTADDTMEVGIGYWIITDANKTMQVNTPLIGIHAQKMADPLGPRTGPTGFIVATTVTDIKGAMTANGTPYGRAGVGSTSDFRVLLSNPLHKSTYWPDLIMGYEADYNDTTTINSYFENNTTTAWLFDPSTNWWKAASTVPGFEGYIAAGQGFSVNFSNGFWTDVLNNISVPEFNLNLAETK